MKYIVIKNKSPYDLEKKVNEKLTKGFKCQGGFAYGILLGKDYYFQAMIKDK